MRNHLGVSLDHPRVLRIRDSYLDAFTDLAPHTELVGTLQLACRVGKIARALTWDRALKAQGYDQAGEFASAPLKCLASLLDESYVGGAGVSPASGPHRGREATGTGTPYVRLSRKVAIESSSSVHHGVWWTGAMVPVQGEEKDRSR